MLTAAAFAEEGDVETARDVLHEVEGAKPAPGERQAPPLRAVPRGPVLARRGPRSGRPLRSSSRTRSRA